MPNQTPVQTPLQIDRIESARMDVDSVRLRLDGRWLDPAGASEEELLVVQVEGRRHRFRAQREPERGDSKRWSASFMLPTWAEPRHEGQAVLWLGSVVIPVPPPGGSSATTRPEAVAPVSGVGPPTYGDPAPAPAQPRVQAEEPTTTDQPAPQVVQPVSDVGEPGPEVAEPEMIEPQVARPQVAQPQVARPEVARAELAQPGDPGPVPPVSSPDEPLRGLSAVASETPRSGPLADLLLKETVSALHAELEQRTADAARVRGALADAQSELEARNALQATLEITHSQLRVELDRLSSAVADQRAELDERMAEIERERTEMRQQLADLAAARDERAAELAAMREQFAGAQAAADRLAAEAARLREHLAASNVRRDAAIGEVGGLRSELERLGVELAATRERVGAEGGDLGEAHRLLADARALAEQLSGRTTAG